MTARRALAALAACLIGHLIPLLPFVGCPGRGAVTAIALSAAVLFGVGVGSLVTLVGDWRKNCPKMVAVGPGAAAAGSFTACLFRAARA